MSGIRHAQIALGLPEPFKDTSLPRLEYVLKGIKRQQVHSGRRPAPRLPITPPIIRKLAQFWESNNDPDRDKLQAACCLGFFGFLRTAEFTAPPNRKDFDHQCHLALTDIVVDNREAPTTVRIRIMQSKTDPFRQGVDIFLGRSHSDVCPVSVSPIQRLTARSLIFALKQPTLTCQSLVRKHLKPQDPSLHYIIAIALELGQPPQPRPRGSKMPSYKRWAAGKAQPTSGT